MGIPEILEEVNKINSLLLALMIIFILVLAVFLFGFPREVVMIFAGFQFGTFFGTVINQIGLFIGSGFGYIIGSRGRNKIEMTSKTVKIKYQEKFEQNAIKALIALRLTPFSPHDTVSMISGFVQLKRRLYFLVSFFTFIPYALLWSFIGQSFFDKIISRVPSNYNITIWLYGLLSFIIIVTLFAKLFVSIEDEEIVNTDLQIN